MKRSMLTALAVAAVGMAMPERNHSYTLPGSPKVGKLAKRRAKNKVARASRKRSRK